MNLCVDFQQTAGIDQKQFECQEEKQPLELARSPVPKNQDNQKEVYERSRRIPNQLEIEKPGHPSASRVRILALGDFQLNLQVSEKSIRERHTGLSPIL